MRQPSFHLHPTVLYWLSERELAIVSFRPLTQRQRSARGQLAGKVSKMAAVPPHVQLLHCSLALVGPYNIKYHARAVCIMCVCVLLLASCFYYGVSLCLSIYVARASYLAI